MITPANQQPEVRMPVVRIRAAALALAALAAGATPLAAQRLSIAPTVGVYIPTTELFKAVQGEEFKQEVSLTVGGRLGLWFGERIGLEFTGDYAPSKLKFSASGDNPDANLFTGTGKLTYFIIPNSKPVYFAVTGGVGHIRRSGDFYKGTNPATGQPFTDDERQDWTGTAGGTVGFRLGRLLHLSVSGETLVYKTNVAETTTGENAAVTQKDIQLKFGVGIPLLGFGS